LLAFIGCVTALAALVAPGGASTVAVAWNVGLGGLATACGVGLVLNQRWAWPIALVLGLALVALGVYVLASPGDIAYPGAALVALVAMVVPGLAMLFIILTPRSLAWFRGRTTASRPSRLEGST
jgi:hypothetical protein